MLCPSRSPKNVPERTGTMNILKWLGAGLLGGCIGAVIWALVYHYADFESGWIAWGIGALAGVGVRIVTDEEHGLLPGSVAVLAAVLALSMGKVGGLYLDLNGKPDGQQRAELTEFTTALVADQIVIDYLHEGKRLDWPSGSNNPPRIRSDYPTDVWLEAAGRYRAFSPQQRDRFNDDPSLLIPEEFLLTYIADDVIKEWEEGGATVQWPNSIEPYSGSWSGDYPEDAWAEANSRWDDMSQSKRTRFRHMFIPPLDGGIANAIALVPHTFTALDVLWFGLALVSAYKIGSDEDD